MARQLINDGILPNDGQGDTLRQGASKINNNFQELYQTLGNGTQITLIENNLLNATGSNKVTFLYQTLADLPSASTYHGMFAHVHGENASYYAHSGAWVKLADANKSIGMFSDVDMATAVPQDGQALVWDIGNSTWKPGDVQAGGGGGGGATAFLGLSDTPTSFSGSSNYFVTVNAGSTGLAFSQTPGSVNVLSDVDTVTTPPTAGQVLKWNGSNWVPGADATSGGGAADADTLDGLDSTYFLNYNNLSNKPSIPTELQDLGIVDGNANQVLTTDGAGGFTFEDAAGGGGASTLGALTDVTTTGAAQGDVLYYDGTGWVLQNGPVIRWTVTANGASDYTFNGPGFVSSTNDPTLYLNRGHTYIFINNSGGSHPFEIRTSFNGSAYSSGVTNNGANNGAIVFTVPMNAPTTLYYQCTAHSGMGNTINIIS